MRSSSDPPPETQDAEPPPESLGNRVLSGAIWTSAGEIARFLLHWAVFVVMARLLNPEDFGIFALGLVVVGLGQLFGEMGLGPSIVQRSKLQEIHIRTAFTVSIILSVVTALAIALFAPLIADLLGSAKLTPVIRVLSLLFLIRGLGLTAESLLQRDLRFPEMARAGVISYFIGYGCVGVGLGLAGSGYWALVWAALVQTLVENAQYILLRSHSRKLTVDGRALRDLLSFGVGASVGRLGNYLALKGDYIVTGRLLGIGPLGIYSRAYGLMSLPVGLYGAVAGKALFSAAAQVHQDRDRLAIAHRRAAAGTALLLLPCGAALSLLAPEVVRVVLGGKWTEVIRPFQFMALGLFFRSGYNVGAAVSKGAGDVHRLAIRQWIYPCLVILAAWLGSTRGVTGVAAAVVGAIAMHFLLITQLSLQSSSLTLRDFLAAHVPALILTAVIGLTTWLSSDLLRSVAVPDILVLLGSLAGSMVVVVLLFRLLPEAVLGKDGIWLVNSIGDLLPSWAPRFKAIPVSFT